MGSTGLIWLQACQVNELDESGAADQAVFLVEDHAAVFSPVIGSLFMLPGSALRTPS